MRLLLAPVMAAHPNAMTFPALPSAISAHIVFWCKGMPTRAVSLSSIFRTWRETPQDIDLGGNDFQMVGVYARRCAAKMIQLLTSPYGATEVCI